MIHEGVLEYVGRAQSAGQPDVRRLSSAVSNVDGFTLVEGEATPLTFKGRPDAARHGAFRRQQRRRAGDLGPSAGRPLDTIANLARTSDGPPRRRGRHGRGRPTYGGPSPPGPTSPSRPCARATSAWGCN